jgi:uncharacterized protein YjiS (DUF1127 family)
MRWCVHVLARLAIAATCTNSAAALDAQVERDEYVSSANSLSEHLMSNSPESVIAIRYNVQSRELRLEPWEKSRPVRQNPAKARRLDSAEMGPQQSAMPVITPVDCLDTASEPSVLSFFIEGFALCGASYCNLLHAIATSPVESSFEAKAENHPVRERRRSLAPAASSTSPRMASAELEEDINRAEPGVAARPSEDAGLAELYTSGSFADRSSRRHWLTRPCSSIANRWAQWRREREIKKTVGALVELDDRTLRDIGIPHRSQIEELVRFCFDC